jgi:hypothetical protein
MRVHWVAVPKAMRARRANREADRRVAEDVAARWDRQQAMLEDILKEPEWEPTEGEEEDGAEAGEEEEEEEEESAAADPSRTPLQICVGEGAGGSSGATEPESGVRIEVGERIVRLSWPVLRALWLRFACVARVFLFRNHVPRGAGTTSPLPQRHVVRFG